MTSLPAPEPMPYDDVLDPVVAGQHGVASRQHLTACGLGPAAVAAQLAARRWQEVGPLVVVLHNGPLTGDQMLHAASLHVSPHGCLAQLTALSVHGVRGFALAEVAVVHPRATSIVRLPWLRVHESRRLRPADVVVRRGLRLTDPARSTVDAVAWQPDKRFAYALPAAVVQQRLSTATRLAHALYNAGTYGTPHTCVSPWRTSPEERSR